MGRGHTPALSSTQVALLLAYSGTRYQGLQKNPGAVTVEEALEAAIHRAGGIADDNVGTLQKVSWSRAGRTDKGVHAVGQIIGVKLVGLDHEQLLDRINHELVGSEVRVLGLERVTQGFCAHTMCSSREYEYLLPTYVLRPSRPVAAVTDGAAAAAAEANGAAAAAAEADGAEANGAAVAAAAAAAAAAVNPSSAAVPCLRVKRKCGRQRVSSASLLPKPTRSPGARTELSTRSPLTCEPLAESLSTSLQP